MCVVLLVTGGQELPLPFIIGVADTNLMEQQPIDTSDYVICTERRSVEISQQGGHKMCVSFVLLLCTCT